MPSFRRSQLLIAIFVVGVALLPLLLFSKLRFKPALTEAEKVVLGFNGASFEAAAKSWQPVSLHLPVVHIPPEPVGSALAKVPTVAPAAPPPTLSFILYDGANSTAIVGGSMVKAGSQVQGWTVEQIERNRVRIRNAKGALWLKLE